MLFLAEPNLIQMQQFISVWLELGSAFTEIVMKAVSRQFSNFPLAILSKYCIKVYLYTAFVCNKLAYRIIPVGLLGKDTKLVISSLV